MAALAHISTLILLQFRSEIPLRGHVSALLAKVLPLVGGVLLVAIPGWTLVIAIATPGEVIRDLVVLPLETYVKMRSLPLPSLAGLAEDLVQRRWQHLVYASAYLPAVAALIGGIAALRFRKAIGQSRVCSGRYRH
jgi:hypothetical protein